MPFRLFTLVATLSFLLCLVTLYLWVRSYDGWRARSFYLRNGWSVQLVSSAGHIEWNEHRFDGDHRMIEVGRELEVPYSALALITGAVPAAFFAWRAKSWLTRYRFRETTRRARCHACGYDLRATSDRCPECGTVIEPPPPDAHQGTATSHAPSAGNTD